MCNEKSFFSQIDDLSSAEYLLKDSISRRESGVYTNFLDWLPSSAIVYSFWWFGRRRVFFARRVSLISSSLTSIPQQEEKEEKKHIWIINVIYKRSLFLIKKIWFFFEWFRLRWNEIYLESHGAPSFHTAEPTSQSTTVYLVCRFISWL